MLAYGIHSDLVFSISAAYCLRTHCKIDRFRSAIWR